MADYYPLIKRAIEALDPAVPGERRRELYERARQALVAQLRSVQPPLGESEITRERLSLEEAVRRVESEVARRATGNVKREEVDASRASTRSWLNEIRFSEPPDPTTDTIAELARLIAERAPIASNYHASEPSSVLQPPLPSLPPISAIPDQNERAIAFRPSRRGPLELLPDPPRDPHDPEQSQLYLRIRQQLVKLKEDIPGQERAQVNDALDDFMDIFMAAGPASTQSCRRQSPVPNRTAKSPTG